ncbi:hypothetical protein LSH36_834g01003 [Paralvinella palmiformis]|uniref:Uncharacterized protein n=1 Tax=Paralvinella palmiformis TaxID=53620 RepID=A0AAD9IZN1_9ANNE|nr:hypothetical protein LSH36_834g01003 [Paralvinella palmiformis]
MVHNVRFSLRGGKTTIVKGTLSLNGSLGELIDDSLLLRRLAASIRTSNGSDVRILMSPETEQVTFSTRNVTSGRNIYDPVGASTFVIAVVLVYGISIVFMISSHVFMKKKTSVESEKRIDSYLSSARRLRDESRRESFAKLKRSLMPVIAKSPSGRVLIEKRLKYTPYLLHYLPATGLSCGSRETNCTTVSRTDVSGVGRETGSIHRAGIGPQRGVDAGNSTDPDWSLTDSAAFTSDSRLTGTSTRQDSDRRKREHFPEKQQPEEVKRERVADERKVDVYGEDTYVDDRRLPYLERTCDSSLSGDDSSIYYSAQSLPHV